MQTNLGNSLLVEWLRICLSMQGMWAPSLVGELRSQMPQVNQVLVLQMKSPCTATTEAHIPQLLSPCALESMLHNKRSLCATTREVLHHNEKPLCHDKRSLCAATGEAPVPQQRPSEAKIKNKKQTTPLQTKLTLFW